MYGQAVMWRSMKPTYDSSIESIRGYISIEVLLYLSLRENYSKLIPNLIQKLNSKLTSLINLICLLISLTFRREGKSSSLSLNNETMVQVLLDMLTLSMYGQAVMWRSMKPTYDSSIESIRGQASIEVLLYLSLMENYSKLIPNLIQKLNSKPTSIINLIYLPMSLIFSREGKCSSLSLNNETMVQVLLDMPTCYFCHLCNFTGLLC